MRILNVVLSILACVAMVSAEGSWTDLGDVAVPGTPIRVRGGQGGYIVEFIPSGWKGGPVDFMTTEMDEDSWSMFTSAIDPPEVSEYFAVQATDADHAEMSIPVGVLRTGPAGDTLWTCIFDTVVAYENIPIRIAPSSWGCWAVTGPEPGGDTWAVVQVSRNGGLLSREEFTLPGGPVISMNHVEETPDRGLAMTGVTDLLGMSLNLVVLRIDPEGVERWRMLDQFDYHTAGDILEMDWDESMVVAGRTGLERDDGWFLPPVDQDVLLLKLYPDGSEAWRSSFEFPGQNTPLLMDLMEEDGILLLMTVYEEDGSSPGRYRLVRFEPPSV